MKLPALGTDATNDMRTLLRGDLYPVVLEESVETRYCPLPPNQVPTTASAILSRGPAKGLLSYVTLRYQMHRKPPKLLHVGQLANSELYYC